MKTYNTKKKITIAVLSLAVVLLAGGLLVYMSTMGGDEPIAVIAENVDEQDNDVNVGDIGGTQKKQDTDPGAQDVTVKVNTPADSDGTSGQSKTSDDKPKTPEEATPPATPEPAHEEEHENTGTDDPNVQPSSTPVSAQAETNTPKSGDKQDGKIYIPGFGWVEDNGGGVEVEEADFELSGELVGDM